MVIIIAVSAVLFLILTFRLIYIQILHYNAFASQAVEQRSQRVTINSGRGDILDRRGRSLLGSCSELSLIVFPSQIRGNEKMISKQLSFLPGAEVIEKASEKREPFVVRQVSSQVAQKIDELNIRGVKVFKTTRRYGPESLATHVVGHIGVSDNKGKVGIEYVFDRELSGGGPEALVALVDAHQRLIKGLGYRQTIPGVNNFPPQNVVLTIDRGIQYFVEKTMDKWISKGSVIVMEPYNGDILAMASRPDYNQLYLNHYLGQEDNLFLNRSILSYSPGSIFKTVIALAALETGAVNMFDRFYCPGFIQIGEDAFNCHHSHPSNILTFRDAFAYSCNTVFMELGIKLGRENVLRYARNLGWGRRTGIELGTPEEGGEVAGRIPSLEEITFLGDLALLSIGQGKVEATPFR